jgi:integrase/recombinase XerD
MNPTNPTVANVLPGFLDYLAVELHYAPATTQKYGDNLRVYVRDIANPRISEMTVHDFITLKARLAERGAGQSYVASFIAALKSLLTYARDILDVQLFVDLAAIHLPRIPRREVVYLTNEELRQFLDAIPLLTRKREPRLSGHRFRAITETLAGTGMRISETLGLRKADVDFELREAKIIGKGNKQRTVFFSEEALEWIVKYLALRTDNSPLLFANADGLPVQRGSVERACRLNAVWAGIDKPVSPHMLRHTMATNLLRNGCPLGFIKEILGHEKLETTCRFYLGMLDKAGMKEAHRNYLNYQAQL